MSYYGIYNLRGKDEHIELTEEQKAEIVKCKTSAEYFLRKYVYISTKESGYVLFPLIERQVNELDVLERERWIRGDWYRQSGYTTLVLGYMLWKAVFSPNIMCVYYTGKRQITIENFKDIVRPMILCIPKWMQPGIKKWTETRVEFCNGSIFYADTYKVYNVSGFSPDYIFLDSFGWLRDNVMLDIVNTSFECLKHSSKTHLILGQAYKFGAKHPGNLIYWKEHIQDFYSSEFYWYEDSRRDSGWEQSERKRLGDSRFEMDYCGKILDDNNIYSVSYKDINSMGNDLNDMVKECLFKILSKIDSADYISAAGVTGPSEVFSRINMWRYIYIEESRRPENNYEVLWRPHSGDPDNKIELRIRGNGPLCPDGIINYQGVANNNNELTRISAHLIIHNKIDYDKKGDCGVNYGLPHNKHCITVEIGEEQYKYLCNKATDGHTSLSVIIQQLIAENISTTGTKCAMDDFGRAQIEYLLNGFISGKYRGDIRLLSLSDTSYHAEINIDEHRFITIEYASEVQVDWHTLSRITNNGERRTCTYDRNMCKWLEKLLNKAYGKMHK